MGNTQIIAELRAAPGRRVFAVGVIYVLGMLLVALALSQPVTALGRFVLALTGVGALLFAERFRKRSGQVLELTDDEFRAAGGAILVPLSQIKRVERGSFAFKPSGGFVLHLNAPGPRAWAPGLYWQIGRRIGVGGVTSPAGAKAMAAQIEQALAARK